MRQHREVARQAVRGKDLPHRRKSAGKDDLVVSRGHEWRRAAWDSGLVSVIMPASGTERYVAGPSTSRAPRCRRAPGCTDGRGGNADKLPICREFVREVFRWNPSLEIRLEMRKTWGT